jgi:hypothetical protein
MICVGADVGSMPIKTLAAHSWAFCADEPSGGRDRWSLY